MHQSHRKTDALFQVIAENTSDLILIAGLDGVIKYCSASCRKLYGYEPDEMIGARSLESIHPADRGRMANLFANLPQEGHFTASYRRQRKNGSYVWVEATTNALRDSRTGQVTEMVAVIRDLTERKHNEEMLRRSEVRFRTLFEESPISLWEEDFSAVRAYLMDLAASGVADLVSYLRNNPDVVRQAAIRVHIFQVNEATLRMYDAETQGQMLAGLHHTFDEESYEVFCNELCAFLEGSTTFHAEASTRTLSGRRNAISIRATILPGYESTWGRVVVSMFDITAHREAERRTRASLEEKELLLKEIHHRVKNNLQVISSLLSLQVRHLPESQAQQMFGECQRRVRSIALVHEQLYRSNDLSHVAFLEYVEAVAAGLSHTFQASERNIHHEVEIASDVQVPIDTAIPCGLLINELVTNSLKHAFPEGRSGVIRIAVTQENGRLTSLVVSDNGIGLPRDIDPSSASTLGLELVSALAKQLHTEVQIDRNGGTAFGFKFPLNSVFTKELE